MTLNGDPHEVRTSCGRIVSTTLEHRLYGDLLQFSVEIGSTCANPKVGCVDSWIRRFKRLKMKIDDVDLDQLSRMMNRD